MKAKKIYIIKKYRQILEFYSYIYCILIRISLNIRINLQHLLRKLYSQLFYILKLHTNFFV